MNLAYLNCFNSNNMKQQSKLDRIAVPDTEWIKEAEYRQENFYWLRMSGQIALAVLRTLRKKEMSQKDLAELMGCSPQYISKIVRGSENLTLETICKLEKVLQIKLIETPYSQMRETISSSLPEQP